MPIDSPRRDSAATLFAALLVVWFAVCIIPFSFLPGLKLKWGGGLAPDHVALLGLGALALFVFPPASARARRSPLVWLYIAYAAWLILSGLFSVHPFRSVRSVIGFLTRGLVPLYVAFEAASRPSTGPRLRRAALVLGVCLGAISVAEVFKGSMLFLRHAPSDPFLADSIWHDGAGIAIGAMGQPLPLSLLAALLLPFAAIEGLTATSGAALLWCLPLIVTIALTYRRTGYAATVVVLALAAMFHPERRARLALLFGAPIVLLAAVLFYAPARERITDRFRPSFTIAEIHHGERRATFQTSLRMWRSRPFWGIGPRMYEERFEEFRKMPYERPSPDNQYARQLAEAGVPGFLLLLALVLYPLAHLWRDGPSREPAVFIMNLVLVPILFFIDGLWYPTILMTVSLFNGFHLGQCSAGERS